MIVAVMIFATGGGLMAEITPRDCAVLVASVRAHEDVGFSYDKGGLRRNIVFAECVTKEHAQLMLGGV